MNVNFKKRKYVKMKLILIERQNKDVVCDSGEVTPEVGMTWNDAWNEDSSKVN